MSSYYYDNYGNYYYYEDPRSQNYYYSSPHMDSRQSRNPTQDPGNRGNSRQNMGSSGQPMGNRQNPGQSYGNSRSEKMDDTSISKNLSNILRHTAEKLDLNLDSHGYIFVDDLLKLKRFTGVTPEDIKRIVKDNDKQRFSLITEERSQKLKIRANQGHSGKFENLNLDLVPIEDPEKYPVVLHGTYDAYWPSISKGGLKRMKRVHIHFAPGLPGENSVISGMRSTCEIYVYIDLKKAIQDGLKFFMSANNVILCSGDKNGIIAPKYFSKVVHRKSGNLLKGDVSPKKKLPVGMVEDDRPKNEQSKKKSKGNAEKNSTDKEACNPKKKKVSKENNDKTEDAKNSESKKKGKNSKKEGGAEKIAPVQVKPTESKTETGGKKKGGDKSSTTVAEKPADAPKNAATKKNKNQDKKSSDKEAGDPKKKKLSEENKVKNEEPKNSESKKKAKKSKKEGETENNSTGKEASNPKKKKCLKKIAKMKMLTILRVRKKKKSPKEGEAEKKSTVKPTESKTETASKKKGSGKSPVVENSGGKAPKNAPAATKKTKNQDKKSSDSSKDTKAVAKKTESKNATVKIDVKANAPKTVPPRVFIIENEDDERLNPLKQQSVVGVHVLKQKLTIAYVLISMPGTVFVFDPTVTKELLKHLLEKSKSQKVMYDCSIVYDLYKQFGIVLYKAPVADIQILHDLSEKRLLSSFAEIVGEVCGKIPSPAYQSLFEKMAEKLDDKIKSVMKMLSHVSGLKTLFDKYKSFLEKSQKATFTKYNKHFDEATRAKLTKVTKDKPTASPAVKKPASQPSSTDVQKKSKKSNK